MYIVIRVKPLCLVRRRKFSTVFARSAKQLQTTNKIRVKICRSVNDANLENMKHYGKNRWRSMLAITFGTLLIIISHLLAPLAHVSRRRGDRKTNLQTVSQVVEMGSVYWGCRRCEDYQENLHLTEWKIEMFAWLICFRKVPLYYRILLFELMLYWTIICKS